MLRNNAFQIQLSHLLKQRHSAAIYVVRVPERAFVRDPCQSPAKLLLAFCKLMGSTITPFQNQ